MVADGRPRQAALQIAAAVAREGADHDLTLVAGWKTLLGRLINDGGRLRLFPHRVMMHLLLAHLSENSDRDVRLAEASKTLADWQRIARGMTTDHAEIGVSPELSPRLSAFMASRRENIGGCFDHFGRAATTLIELMGQGVEQRFRLTELADYVSTDLLPCMNQLVVDFAAELGDTAECERDVGLTTRRDVASLRSSAVTASQLADELARVNASVQMIALNALIEAARSGEDGRAFGAVAVEIKALSGKIASLTADIRAHLSRT